MSSYLIEECWILSVSAIKRDLRKIRDNGNVEGQITLRNGKEQMQFSYWSEYRDNESYIAVAIPNAVPIEIKLHATQLTFGISSFLECPQCSKSCSKLFIHPEIGKGWKCAKCHKLKYHLQSFNMYSRLGIGEYRLDQFDKFCLRKKPRMFYGGKPTKPLMRSIHRMQKIGLFKEAQDFISQIEEYKGLSKRISIMSDFLQNNGNLAVGR